MAYGLRFGDSLDQLRTLPEAQGAEAGDAELSCGGNGQPARNAIFLHAGWRTCGTWLWEALRERPNIRAFYEPLHEDLARLNAPGIGHFRPDSWGSGHGHGAPYFAEFNPLLGPSGAGVSLYQRRFAFDDFFQPPDRPDQALEAYVSQLLDSAHAEARLPVLKFCRSLGRIGWMMQRFPQASHAVILRDPASQWWSARAQMEQDGNRYFVLAPFMILARNPGQSLLADAMDRLGVAAPAQLGGSFDTALLATWRHVERLGWAQRYRGFLAVWAASAVAAEATGAMVIDADGLRGNARHRQEIEAWLAASGAGIDLRQALPPRPVGAWPGPAAEARDAAAAALAALGFVAEHRFALRPGRAAALARKLAPRFTQPDGVQLPPLNRTSLPPPPAAPQRSLKLRQADAAAYVAFQRVTYPLRRAHYYVWRWLGWHAGPGVKAK